MLKKALLFLLFSTIALSSQAQKADTLFNRLGDFDLARLYNKRSEAITLGEKIMPDTAKLTEKVRISFFGRMAKLYEDNEQDEKAIFYYQKVVAALPDYYVARRAIGYLYFKQAREAHVKLNAAGNGPQYDQLLKNYTALVKKTLPHLEKAQACDPSNDTLELIKTLYKNIHDDRGLNSLNGRLADMGKNCIDILTDH